MNKNIIIALHLLTPALLYSNTVKLESTILRQIDGLSIGINGEVIALLKQYKANITDIILGARTPEGRIGHYQLEGKKYNVQELRQQEIERGTTPQFEKLRQQIRNDFERISTPFRASVHNVKSVMALLIEESMSKRNRLDSLLYTWAKASEKNEYELFEKHVKSIKDLEIFLTDLTNFISDLIYSCPRACAQFNEQMEKFNKAKQFALQLNLHKDQQILFFKYINSALPNLVKHEITKGKIEELYMNFRAGK